MKYVILADSKSDYTFKEPRQLTKINGEPLIKRTIRLLKENGIKDILITSHDEKFDNMGAKRYEPKFNDYDSINKTGYWLSAFPIELLCEPITFIWGDVYFSEKAIKKIIKTETDSTMFFCTYNNEDKKYIKHHDEPLAYKVVDYELFKEHISKVKKMYDFGLCVRHPIVWELYRSINGQDINIHKMTKNYIAINDESCDIDSVKDIIMLNMKVGGKNMIKCEVVKEFTLERFDELKNIVRYNPNLKQEKRLYLKDTFECEKELADYLMGGNPNKEVVVKVIEVIPKKTKKASVEDENVVKEEKPKKPRKRKTTKK